MILSTSINGVTSDAFWVIGGAPGLDPEFEDTFQDIFSLTLGSLSTFS